MEACASHSSRSNRGAGFAALLAGLLAAACTTAPAPPLLPAPLCAGDGLAIHADFPAAGRHDCVIAPDGSVIISVDHEPAVIEGINPSPWFAFRIAPDSQRSATVVLDYTDYTHRYRPHVSSDGLTWTQLPDDSVTLNERRTRASVQLDVAPPGLWVAGQPLSPASANLDWTRSMVVPRGFSEVEYGRSLKRRSLTGFLGGGEGGDGLIVALTRQHPPETTGQDAFQGFVERLVTRDDQRARDFRAAHRIVLAPMPNPDGVDGGFWRLNAGGVDLNRDWGAFTQPETIALSNWILEQAEGRRTVAFMDFHSTNRTVIYAPPLDAPSPAIDFLPFLEQRFNAELSAPPEWSYAHNENAGTSKGWSLDVLKAPGITVELWDHVSQEDARALGASAADALIAYFTH